MLKSLLNALGSPSLNAYREAETVRRAMTPIKLNKGEHGDAKWVDLARAGFCGDPRAKPLLGGLQCSDGSMTEVCYPHDGHLITVSRPGGGKNRCVVIPNLITYGIQKKGQGGASVIVNDPHLENLIFTGPYRAQFQPVWALAPFEDDLPPGVQRATFNPIDVVRADRDPLTAAIMIAETLIRAGGKEPHWAEGAQLVFAAYVLFVAFDKFWKDDERHLGTCWRIFASPRWHSEMLWRMVNSDIDFVVEQASKLSLTVLDWDADEQKLVRVPNPNMKEQAAIKSTLYVQGARTFSEPRLIDAMRSSNIDFGSLRGNPQSIYVSMSQSRSKVHDRWMKMMHCCGMRQIENLGKIQYDENGNRPPAIYVVMDEFALLNRVDYMVDVMAGMRGHGVRVHLVVQSFSQLKHIYGDSWMQILGNASLVQYFGGTMDRETAEIISLISGEKTWTHTSLTETVQVNGGSQNHSLFGRRLIMPDQVMRLPENQQILCIAGHGAAQCLLVNPDKDFREHPRYQQHLQARGLR